MEDVGVDEFEDNESAFEFDVVRCSQLEMIDASRNLLTNMKGLHSNKYVFTNGLDSCIFTCWIGFCVKLF